MTSLRHVAVLLALSQAVSACACLKYRELKVAAASRMSECQTSLPDESGNCDTDKSQSDAILRTTWDKCIKQTVGTSLLVLLAVGLAIGIAAGAHKGGCDGGTCDNFYYY